MRSAVGKRNGTLRKKLSTELLGDVLLTLLGRNELPGEAIDQVVVGCINQLGMQASNVVRNAWLGARLPLEVPAASVNAQYGSSQEVNTFAHALVAGGLADIVISCGVESMTQVPLGSTAPIEPDYGNPRGGRYAHMYEPTTQFEGAVNRRAAE